LSSNLFQSCFVLILVCEKESFTVASLLSLPLLFQNLDI
jgi:hypothetical protein